jgi:hypothetical protein
MKQTIACLIALALALPLAGAKAQSTNKVAVNAGMLSASSVYSGYTPIKAFDGDLSQNSGWTTSGGVLQAWLAVDFGKPKNVAYVRVFPDRYIASNPTYSYLDRFRVEVLSNATWQGVTPLITTSEEQWYVAEVNLPVTQLRFWCESDGNGPQVKEIEIYEVVMPPRLTISRTNGLIAVAWPASGADFLLEATNALPDVAAPWPVIPPPYQTNGPNLQFIEPAVVGNKFYRLDKP